MNLRRPWSRPRALGAGVVAGLAVLALGVPGVSPAASPAIHPPGLVTAAAIDPPGLAPAASAAIDPPGLVTAAATGAPGAVTAASRPTPRPWASQPLVVLLGNHVARRAPNADARPIEAVAARRPLTRVPTVLPVLGHRGRGDAWLRVRLPGRPNGHTGWIAAARTRPTSTPWAIVVSLSRRQVTVSREGQVVRRFAAIVGKPSTPTPVGNFFVEEALRLSPSASGAPFALATSARSDTLREFDGGPGQIALHGTDNLSGSLGTAVSHGCVRLAPRAVTWLARRIGAGVPLSIVRRG